MSGILFDTSIYISALRQGDASILNLRRASRTSDQQPRPLWLSVVVLEELYVDGEREGAAGFAMNEGRVPKDRVIAGANRHNWMDARKVFT